MLQDKTILIVDEDRVFAEVYGRYLLDNGANILYAHESREALTLLEAESVDLIIAEVMLPGKNGLRLIKDLRTRSSTRTTPVIFLTVIEAADVGLYASLQESLGVGAYLVKQRTTPEEVVTVVTDLTGAI